MHNTNDIHYLESLMYDVNKYGAYNIDLRIRGYAKQIIALLDETTIGLVTDAFNSATGTTLDKKIKAIKVLRELTDFGLMPSNEIVKLLLNLDK